LGGGLPIGATMLGQRVENLFSAGMNGSTFGGNPVACAGALSILKRIDEKLLQEVREKSAYIFAELTHAKGVKGRIEVVPVPAPYTVIIDYAHTPDALENILSTVRPLTPKRVICVVGCGGDRDRSKRALMGEIAGELADLTFLTSDNPRTEDPLSILLEMLPGMERSGGAWHLIPDRQAAIRAALTEAREGDLVLLAGKGHETYQEIQGIFLHLDEREEITAFFQNDKRYGII